MVPLWPAGRRHRRVLLWLDESNNTEDLWVEHYVGGERVSCHNVRIEPFDDPRRALDLALRTLDTQLRLL